MTKWLSTIGCFFIKLILIHLNTNISIFHLFTSRYRCRTLQGPHRFHNLSSVLGILPLLIFFLVLKITFTYIKNKKPIQLLQIIIMIISLAHKRNRSCIRSSYIKWSDSQLLPRSYVLLRTHSFLFVEFHHMLLILRLIMRSASM